MSEGAVYEPPPPPTPNDSPAVESPPVNQPSPSDSPAGSDRQGQSDHDRKSGKDAGQVGQTDLPEPTPGTADQGDPDQSTDESAVDQGFLSDSGTWVSDNQWKGGQTPPVEKSSGHKDEAQTGSRAPKSEAKFSDRLAGSPQEPRGASGEEPAKLEQSQPPTSSQESGKGISKPESEDLASASVKQNLKEDPLERILDPPRSQDLPEQQDRNLVNQAAEQQFDHRTEDGEQERGLASGMRDLLSEQEGESSPRSEKQGSLLADALGKVIDRQAGDASQASKAEAFTAAAQENRRTLQRLREEQGGERGKLTRKELLKGERLVEAVRQRKQGSRQTTGQADSRGQERKPAQGRTLQWVWNNRGRGSRSVRDQAPTEIDRLRESLSKEKLMEPQQTEGHISPVDNVVVYAYSWKGAGASQASTEVQRGAEKKSAKWWKNEEVGGAEPAEKVDRSGGRLQLKDGTSLERGSGATRLEHSTYGKLESDSSQTIRYEGLGVTVTVLSTGAIAVGGSESAQMTSNGTMLVTTENGSTVSASPDGSLQVKLTDGSRRGINRNGEVSIEDGKGWSVQVTQGGSITERTSSDKRSARAPDGSETTTYAFGYLVRKSFDGTVTVTKPTHLIDVRAPETNLEARGWGAYLFPGINPLAWDREVAPAGSDQDRALIESPELKRGAETLFNISQDTESIHLTREDMEDALRFGLPPGTELTDFEKELINGTIERGHEFSILLDVERGTVGYVFHLLSGAGTKFYDRTGEMEYLSTGVGLEDPGITPLDFVGLGASLTQGLVKISAKNVAKMFTKEEVKEGAADLGARFIKEGAGEADNLASHGVKKEIEDQAAVLGQHVVIKEVPEKSGEIGSQVLKSAKDETAAAGTQAVKGEAEELLLDLGTLASKYGENAQAIVNKYGKDLGTDILRSYDDIAGIPGADQLMKDLITKGYKGADSTNIGALSELGYAAGLKRQGFEIERLGDRVNGKKAIDILVKDGPAIDVKSYNWRDPYFQRPKNIDQTAANLAKQAATFQKLYPGHPVEYAFTDLQNAPQKIISTLENMNVRVTEVTWPRRKN